jgi:hypothetical protein
MILASLEMSGCCEDNQCGTWKMIFPPPKDAYIDPILGIIDYKNSRCLCRNQSPLKKVVVKAKASIDQRRALQTSPVHRPKNKVSFMPSFFTFL